VVIGAQNSRLAKWMVQNRRKAGEERRNGAAGKQQR
jgi:hypothetical protein